MEAEEITDEQLEIFNRQFHFTKEQLAKFYEWRASLPEKYYGCDSNGITVLFPQCSIGVLVIAERADGEKIDLTDWENF